MVPACKGETLFLKARFQREGGFSLVRILNIQVLACDYRKREFANDSRKAKPGDQTCLVEKPVMAYPL